MDGGVGFIYMRSVHAQTMSLTEGIFDMSLPNSNSAAALHPRRPRCPTLLGYVLAPTPPLPVSTKSYGSATPPCAPTPSTTPCRQQRGRRHVTWASQDDVAHCQQRQRHIPGPVACHPHRALSRATAAAPTCHRYRHHRWPLPSTCRRRRRRLRLASRRRHNDATPRRPPTTFTPPASLSHA